MRFRGNEDQVAELRRASAAEIATLRKDLGRWRGRAERLLGVVQQYDQELDRLRTDNTTLSQRLIDLAMRPPTVIQAPAVDVNGILESYRKTFSPDVIINGRPDAADEQRAGIVWADQGLDNTGGTPESVRDPFDDEKVVIPDYVLEIEGLDPNTVKGSKGGWYNPK